MKREALAPYTVFLLLWSGQAELKFGKAFDVNRERIELIAADIGAKGLQVAPLAKEKTAGAMGIVRTDMTRHGNRRVMLSSADGDTYFYVDYDSGDILLVQHLNRLPPTLAPEQANRVMADTPERAEYCRVSLAEGRRTALTWVRRVLGQRWAEEFSIQKEKLAPFGYTPRYEYTLLPGHASDFFDDRRITVTVNPRTGQVVCYQLLGEHHVADYRPKISREEALARFWQHHSQHRTRLKLYRIGLVKIENFVRPETWYWQICTDYKVNDLEAFQRARPWAGDTARLSAWIDAESGEIFGAMEPWW